MTVGELINRLKEMPASAKVGAVDDMGECEEVTRVDAPNESYKFVQLEVEVGWHESYYRDE